MLTCKIYNIMFENQLINLEHEEKINRFSTFIWELVEELEILNY